MPIFLDTRGNSTLGLGVCSRCSRKFPLDELVLDPNNQLRVCKADQDQYDPWRLAARQPDNYKLPFTRPDTPLDPVPTYVPDPDG